MITVIDESLVGKTVWYFDSARGVCHIKVTGIEAKPARYRNRGTQYGLYYDYESNARGRHTLIFWPGERPVFESRAKCEAHIRALLKKSEADAFMDKILID